MKLAACLRAMMLVSPLVAGGWEPIPQSVWAMKEDSAKGIKGAVVLEDRIALRGTYLEFTYRVRVLSEAGLGAVELNAFSSDCYDFEGRTTYPDGRSIVISKAKDFQTKTALETAFGDVKQTKVVPPGVNGDCVVELRWRESADHKRQSPLPKRWGYSENWRFGNPFFTQLSVLEIPVNFPYAYQVRPSRTHEPHIETKGSVHVVSFRDLPAVEPIPYALATARDVPWASFYYQPHRLNLFVTSGPEAYWKNAVDSYFKGYLDRDVKKGKAFRALCAELSAGLPAAPQAKAYQLALNLDARIRNTSQATFEELGKRSKDHEEPDRQDLEASAKQGETDEEGMGLLFFHLLKSQGIHPKVALVAQRNQRLFSFQQMNAFQFSRQIYGVDEPGKETAWYDPGLRFANPGLIHPDYQGTSALQIDSRDWSVATVNLSAQPALTNIIKLDYALDLQEEADVFKLKQQFSGAPDLYQRKSYLALEAKEQNRLLKEEMERKITQAQITRAEVQNASSPKENISFLVEGRLEREAGRRRVVDPFPGMAAALWIPDDLPEKRTVPILIPYLRVQLAVSTFKLPQGYRLGALAPFQKKNTCGEVNWVATVTSKEGVDEVKVVLRVDVAGFFLDPSAYGEFRDFLGWVRGAHGRALVLEKI